MLTHSREHKKWTKYSLMAQLLVRIFPDFIKKIKTAFNTHSTDLLPRMHWCHSFWLLLPEINQNNLFIIYNKFISLRHSHLMILVSLAIVNPRWSFTKQLTTASSYRKMISSRWYNQDTISMDDDSQ